MSTATHELRFRPLGRGTFVGGFFVTLLIHIALAGLVWYGNIKAPVPEEKERIILITQNVKLGKKREKFWLPRIEQPPPPKAPEPEIKVATDPAAAPTVKKEEKEKPEKPPEKRETAQDVMNRRRAMLQQASEEFEGSPTGSANSTATVATEGDPYATKIFEAIRKNWNVPTGLSIGEVITLEVRIVISISEDGTILTPRLLRPSGNGLYDDSCLQAVQATRRVDPPPPAQRARYRKGIALDFGGKELAH